MAQIVLYHLLPGVPVLIATVIFANPYWGLGLPVFLSLMIAFALCLVPGQWLIMLMAAHKQRKKLRDIIEYKEKMPINKTVLWILPGVVLAALIFTVGTEIEEPLWTIFSWIPEWFRVERSMSGLGSLLIITIILNFTIRGLLVPFTEEVYF